MNQHTITIRIAGPREDVSLFASQISQIFGISDVTAIFNDKGHGCLGKPRPGMVHQKMTVFVPPNEALFNSTKT
jgi:hypothetical protein